VARRYDVLIRKLVALTGSPVPRRLTFEPAFKRNKPESKAFVAILNCILANIDHATVLAPPFVLAELEDALIVSMLFNFAHNLRELLEQEVLDAGSWQVRRVENTSKPISMRRLILSGSPQSPHQYAQHLPRVQTQPRILPMAFARQRRLQQARRMLEGSDTDQTVTSVAFVCGFNDVGHFSREFSKAFGEAPSAVLGKRPR